ncbi:hypothetical protein BX600DRAFT_415021 [Xylariales sp. PMI_506]|nr:hypothetical protein BX600DRAFT_415021 [Xylariales sp. PMI_506]
MPRAGFMLAPPPWCRFSSTASQLATRNLHTYTLGRCRSSLAWIQPIRNASGCSQSTAQNAPSSFVISVPPRRGPLARCAPEPCGWGFRSFAITARSLSARPPPPSATATEYPFVFRQGWRPGQEPGIDPSKPDGGRPEQPSLQAECDITVVDFSEDDIVVNDMTNSNLASFLSKPREDWVKCRWINVNGLSWDVIQEIGRHKNLHPLAIEDLMNTNNRTKADWYADHIYMVLPLQKLNQITGQPGHRHRGLRHRAELKSDPETLPNSLHRHRAGPNQERAAFMEENSLMTSKNLCVSSEQVSIFLAADNTLVTFFEASGNDVEDPVITRLSSRDTILRHSCDVSMLCQAVIDAIIDLSFPVVTAYQDAIGDLELDVLTSPSIRHTKSLYVITSEIATMRSAISPIIGLINTLRDHRPGPMSASSLHHVQSTSVMNTDAQPHHHLRAGGMSSVSISPLAITYFTDVLDHCFLITDALDQMRHTSDGLIGLIFNTIGTRQNESMKQLTFVSIIFLPLSFLTGYFGMNFQTFPSLEHSELWFWCIAIPVATMTMLLLMRGTIYRHLLMKARRLNILRSRQQRLQSNPPSVKKTQ